jgi:hypothetical protein
VHWVSLDAPVTPSGGPIVNVARNSSLPQSYHTSPLDAACEVPWLKGVVVVVSAGNNGAGMLYPPANNPYPYRQSTEITGRCYRAISQRKASYLPVGSRCMQQIRNAYCNVARILLDPGSFSHG